MMRAYDHNGELVIEFESEHGYSRGQLVLREAPYGIAIVCPAVDPTREIALLDLWSMNKAFGVNPAVTWDERVMQIVLYSPRQTDDPVAYAEVHRGQTVVHFANGVLSRFDPYRNDGRFPVRMSDKVFGYFDDEVRVP